MRRCRNWSRHDRVPAPLKLPCDSAHIRACGDKQLARRGNTWIKISGANRVAATDLPPYDDVKPLAHALIEAAPERIMWGSDWRHPNKYVANPNDGDLVDAFGDWVSDEGMRRKIMVDTPAAFYRFADADVRSQGIPAAARSR
jgi:predicted TIM-barrel fold metal-dependent hydrolase